MRYKFKLIDIAGFLIVVLILFGLLVSVYKIFTPTESAPAPVKDIKESSIDGTYSEKIKGITYIAIIKGNHITFERYDGSEPYILWIGSVNLKVIGTESSKLNTWNSHISNSQRDRDLIYESYSKLGFAQPPDYKWFRYSPKDKMLFSFDDENYVEMKKVK